MSDQDDVSILNTLTSSRILTEKIGNLKTKMVKLFQNILMSMVLISGLLLSHT